MTPLEAHIAAETTRPLHPDIAALAGMLAAHGGVETVAVLFYGSGLRTGARDGVLDFYVLLRSLRGWKRSRAATLANRILPPNIEYWQRETPEGLLRAKVAILRLDQFRRLTDWSGLDTTVWARFAQPASLAWTRDEAARAETVTALAQAVATAARWAAMLGPAQGRAEDYWRALFAETYSAELRVERASRAADIVDAARTRYRALLPLAWTAGGIAFQELSDGMLKPNLQDATRARAARAWRRRRRCGKPLNAVRLAKASFTFAGGADYIAWKIERHSAVRLEMTPWQRRHPLLASPALVWQLWRKGGLSRKP